MGIIKPRRRYIIYKPKVHSMRNNLHCLQHLQFSWGTNQYWLHNCLSNMIIIIALDNSLIIIINRCNAVLGNHQSHNNPVQLLIIIIIITNNILHYYSQYSWMSQCVIYAMNARPLLYLLYYCGILKCIKYQ